VEEFTTDPLSHISTLSEKSRKVLRQELRKRKQIQLQQERSELLQDRDDYIHQRKKQQQEDALQAAEAITESLRRTKLLLERELERSGKTLEKLSESNKVIADTLDEQNTYRDETKLAGGVRTKMKRREYSDMFFISLAGGFYLLTILYILFARFSFLFRWMFFWM